ncbi:hypothetical protein KTAU_10670 [Thermogemmatispora aurantia]|uniref:Uncharacterized protein n=1 Tax=Thermogemmatispora aurantia TaxID=2045279 RepID=A0A5J4K6Y2_9CHLR|nr:hypothetical protein KTAU_10670 [Thermogemmatispora aurantia]
MLADEQALAGRVLTRRAKLLNRNKVRRAAQIEAGKEAPGPFR